MLNEGDLRLGLWPHPNDCIIGTSEHVGVTLDSRMLLGIADVTGRQTNSPTVPTLVSETLTVSSIDYRCSYSRLVPLICRDGRQELDRSLQVEMTRTVSFMFS